MSKENRVSDERLADLLERDSYRMYQSVLPMELSSMLAELQSLRSKPVAGVEVKALDWSQGWGERRSATPFGDYRLNANMSGHFDWHSPSGEKHWAWTESIAKAAAEADYRQRILSALLPKATAPVVSEPVAKPYAFEFGKSNGDGTYCVVIERGDEGYVERFAVRDWPIKPLYASPRPDAVIDEDMAKSIAYHLCMHKDLKITLGQMEFVEDAVSNALAEVLAAASNSERTDG